MATAVRRGYTVKGALFLVERLNLNKIIARQVLRIHTCEDNAALKCREECKTPITYGNIYSQIYDFDALLQAHQRAQKKKRDKREIALFERNREENLINLQNELIWHKWEPAPPREFLVYEPKQRLIHAPQYCDRVVHHSLCAVIEPLLERKMVFHSFACRKGKGTHRAANLAQQYSKELSCRGLVYYLKCDIRKYFSNIDHWILKKILRRTIRDREALLLIDTIIDADGEGGKGLPIGALTSQLFANVYLGQLDHLIKDEMGVKYYTRYMDDFVIFSNDKDELRVLLKTIGYWLDRHLKLALNHKTKILRASEGLDFCGYRIWPGYRLPRKRNVRRMRKRLRKMVNLYKKQKCTSEAICQSWQSFLGYMKHCKSHKTVVGIYEDLQKQLKEE